MHGSHARGWQGGRDVNEEGFIIEFHQVGAYVRVTIMDPGTLTEVTTLGPSSLSRDQLVQAAIRKLKYVLARPGGPGGGGTVGERK